MAPDQATLAAREMPTTAASNYEQPALPAVVLEPLQSVPLPDLEVLENRIAELSARIQAATYELLCYLREFDRRYGWEGFRSCAHWLNWRTGLALGAAREKMRVAEALADLNHVSAAMACGRLSYSKVRALTRVASPATEACLVAIACGSTAAQVERLVRGWRQADRAAQPDAEVVRLASRTLSTRVDEDGMVVLRARLTPEVGAVVLRAVEAAVGQVRAPAEGDAPGIGQRRADALGLVAESALAGGLDPGAPGDRYQVTVHVDADRLRRREPAQSAAQVSAETREMNALASESGAPVSAKAQLAATVPVVQADQSHGCGTKRADIGPNRRLLMAGTPRGVTGSASAGVGSSTEEQATPAVARNAPGWVVGSALDADRDFAHPEADSEDRRESAPSAVDVSAETRELAVPALEPAATVAGPGPEADRIGFEACVGRQAEGEPFASEDGAEECAGACGGGKAVLGIGLDVGQTVIEQAGGLHVGAEVARRIACDAGLVVLIQGSGGEVLDVGRRTRAVPTALRRALAGRDGNQCQFPGCDSRHCDAHHVEHWADGGETRLANLVSLCRFHHRTVHEGGFQVVVDSAGQFRFLRPDGEPMPEVPPAASWRGAGEPLAPTVARLQAAGVTVGPHTATPDWYGEKLDVTAALDALWEPRQPACAGPEPD